MSVLRLVLLFLLSFAFTLSSDAAAHAAGWFDDFNDGNVLDGNPVMWTQLDLSGNLPGTYDATSGDYRLATPGDPKSNTLTSWVDNESFTDSYIRAQGLVLPTAFDGNLLLFGRIETVQKNAYILALDSSGELQLQMALFGGFNILDLATVNLGDLNAKSDIIFELDVLADSSIGGNRLYGYAWRPGSLKPAIPQIEATDTTFADFVPQGPAGIGFNEVNNYINNDTAGLFRYVEAQSIPFLDGDYNGNRAVDAADYVLWRKGGPLTNEVHNPGTVSQEDFTEWRVRFGNSASGTGDVAELSQALPEPATIILSLVGLVATMYARGVRSE